MARKTDEKRLLDFLAFRQKNRPNNGSIGITGGDVKCFRRLIRSILKNLGEDPNEKFPYDDILEDLLELQYFDCMIPFKGLLAYMRIRRTHHAGIDPKIKHTKPSTAIMLERIAKFPKGGRLLEDQPWWEWW
jgi:hypothetical protein